MKFLSHWPAILALSLLGFSHIALAASQYGAPVDIGGLTGGQHNSVGTAINNQNQVIGYSDMNAYYQPAFVYDATHGFQELELLSALDSSAAGAINDAGVIAGVDDSESGETLLVYWDTAHVIHNLGAPDGYLAASVTVTGINASDQICGVLTTYTGASEAFVYSSGAFHFLAAPAGYSNATASGINASGQIAGAVTDSQNNTHAFLHSGLGPILVSELIAIPTGYVAAQSYGNSNAGQVVGTLTDSSGNTAGFAFSGGVVEVTTSGGLYRVNNTGTAVGTNGAQPFLYTIAGGAVQTLTGNSSIPAGINDANHTVGYLQLHHYKHACLDGQDIGAFPGSSDSEGAAINQAGQVAGFARTDGARRHAFLYDAQGLHDLGTLLSQSQPANAMTSIAYDINNAGHLAGYSTTSNDSTHAVLYDPAHGFQDLGLLPGGTFSLASGLNDSDRVVGYGDVTGSIYHAFVWSSATGMQDMGVLPGGAYSYANKINAAGQAVGASDTAGHVPHAFLWTSAAGMQDLGLLPGGADSGANGVNAGGAVVGNAGASDGNEHAFLWTKAAGMQDLGLLSGGTASNALGINSAGVVVGKADTNGVVHAFIWDSVHGMRDLNTLIPAGSGFTLTQAEAINDKGQITGYGVNAQGQTHGFLMSPATHTQLLWNNTNGQASLWTVNADGIFSNVVYGPYAGWTAKAVAAAPNGSTYLLWSNTNGQASLWHVTALTPTGYTASQYGSYPGYHAVSLSVGGDGSPHILWDKTDGTALLWTVNPANGSFTYTASGPYAGWTAKAVASGATVTDLLWTKTDGTASGFRIATDGSLTYHTFGPYSGYAATALSVGPDDGAHLLWNKTDGTALLWNVDFTAGTFTYTPYGPFSGWSAKAIATGPDNVSHILWDNTNGTASLWNVTGSGYTYNAYGPFSGWSAVGVSAGP